jgi:hypothetical protein
MLRASVLPKPNATRPDFVRRFLPAEGQILLVLIFNLGISLLQRSSYLFSSFRLHLLYAYYMPPILSDRPILSD